MGSSNEIGDSFGTRLALCDELSVFYSDEDQAAQFDDVTSWLLGETGDKPALSGDVQRDIGNAIQEMLYAGKLDEDQVRILGDLVDLDEDQLLPALSAS